MCIRDSFGTRAPQAQAAQPTRKPLSAQHPETIALHGGQAPDPTTNARAVPVYQTTSYVFNDAEHAADLFAHTLPQFGIEVRFANPSDPGEVERLADDKTRAVFAESIANPRVNVIDVDAWADAAHAKGLPLIVDNTVATPILCRVFDHGADISVHSLTKFIGGHGTSIGGIIVDSGKFDWPAHSERFPGLTKPDQSYHGVVWSDALGPAAYIGRVRTVLLRNIGAALSPFNAFLILQGIETLPLRIEPGSRTSRPTSTSARLPAPRARRASRSSATPARLSS